VSGVANAISFATTMNGNIAQAQSTAGVAPANQVGVPSVASSGQAQATAQTNFVNTSAFQTSATSQLGGTAPASALAQIGGVVPFPNTINAGQSFSVANAFAAGPLLVALGSMGAGGVGTPLSYQQTADFILNAAGGGIFAIDLLGSTSLGTGFDSAAFQ